MGRWKDPAGDLEPKATAEEDALSFLAELATQVGVGNMWQI